MKTVPVIDLLSGQVVRGVAGRRDEYLPVRGILSNDAAPRSIGAAFARLGCDTCYVADLDAIAEREPVWTTYAELIDCGLQLWIDAGLANECAAQAMAAFAHERPAISGVVAGLESLAARDSLARLLDLFGAERLIFSLDLKAGEPLTSSPAWAGQTAEEIALAAIELGVARMIVLDLAQVGVGQGLSTLPLCRRLRVAAPDLELTSGGGVRDSADLAELEAAGCNAALVASALHDGRITAADLRR